ncbi:hypothetical protein P303_06875 [Xylella fastidiosa MUL0034]|nr:hypothetical protein P303_06875 [Xylella fastidiosa MUL0034]
MVGWLGGWVVGWLGGWVVGWLGGWVVGWFGWLGGWVVGWLGGWVSWNDLGSAALPHVHHDCAREMGVAPAGETVRRGLRGGYRLWFA